MDGAEVWSEYFVGGKFKFAVLRKNDTRMQSDEIKNVKATKPY